MVKCKVLLFRNNNAFGSLVELTIFIDSCKWIWVVSIYLVTLCISQSGDLLIELRALLPLHGSIRPFMVACQYAGPGEAPRRPRPWPDQSF